MSCGQTTYRDEKRDAAWVRAIYGTPKDDPINITKGVKRMIAWLRANVAECEEYAAQEKIPFIVACERCYMHYKGEQNR